MAEEYRNNATEKQSVKELTDRLEKGLDELFESERYKMLPMRNLPLIADGYIASIKSLAWMRYQQSI